MLVQIQLYFNRNVRLFTARTTTVTCIHVLLAAEGGGGSIEPVEPPRYGPDQGFAITLAAVSLDAAAAGRDHHSQSPSHRSS